MHSIICIYFLDRFSFTFCLSDCLLQAAECVCIYCWVGPPVKDAKEARAGKFEEQPTDCQLSSSRLFTLLIV